jgi:hypothetical protein
MIEQYLPNNNETATVAFRQKFCQLNSPTVQCQSAWYGTLVAPASCPGKEEQRRLAPIPRAAWLVARSVSPARGFMRVFTAAAWSLSPRPAIRSPGAFGLDRENEPSNTWLARAATRAVVNREGAVLRAYVGWRSIATVVRWSTVRPVWIQVSWPSFQHIYILKTVQNSFIPIKLSLLL